MFSEMASTSKKARQPRLLNVVKCGQWTTTIQITYRWPLPLVPAAKPQLLRTLFHISSDKKPEFQGIFRMCGCCQPFGQEYWGIRIPKNSFPKNHKHLTGEEGLHLNGVGKYLFPYLVISVGCWRGRYDARFLLLMPSLCLQYLSESDQRGQFTENHTNDLQLEKECWKRMLKESRHWQLTIKNKKQPSRKHKLSKTFFPLL